MGSTVPGPLNQISQPVIMDAGTLCVHCTDAPGTEGLDAGTPLAKPRWNPQHIADYRDFITREGMPRAQTTEKFDCADWTFAMLIRFARDNGLPLKFHKVGSGDVGSLWQHFGERDNIEAVAGSGFDPAHPDTSPGYSDYIAIEKLVRNEMGARDLILTGFDNTLPISAIESLLPGDMVVLVSGEHRHIQLVLANKVSIQVWDEAKKTNQAAVVLDILQGDLPANIIRRAGWDLTSGQYYRYNFTTKIWTMETDTPGDIRKLWMHTIYGRGWNFDRFNEALP